MRTHSVVALCAATALIAGGSGAIAAQKITGAQIQDGSITGRDVKNKSLTPADFRGAVRGARGPGGPQGIQGPAGPPGPVAAGAIARVEAQGTADAGNTNFAQAVCPPGQRVIGGGFVAGGADTEIFINDSVGSSTSWFVALDNFDGIAPAAFSAIAYCAPAGAAIVPRSAADARTRLLESIEQRRESRQAP